MTTGLDKTTYSNDVRSAPQAFFGERVADGFEVDISTGLSDEEALRRLAADGLNVIAEKRPNPLLRFLISQISSIVIWLLAFAALTAWLTGSELEALAILVVLILNALIGFAIEWRAGRALEALRKTTSAMAKVRRSGREKIIDAARLTAGDIIILTAGDRIPADARIVEAFNLRADESTLTGESVPVEKASDPVNRTAPLSERRSMFYLGTTVVAGHAVAIITATGKNTEMGRIGRLVSEAEDGQTPLEKKLTGLGKKLVYIVLGIALIVFIAGVLRGEKLGLMLEVAISLAVAAVPEGLPAVTTLILALGVLRMARHNAIVRRLSAVETLGSSTVICSDKTGTLTENRMTVQEYHLADDRLIEISAGSRGARSAEKLKDDNLKRILTAGIICNEATFDAQAREGEQAIGDPTETALLIAARAFGLDPSAARAGRKTLYEQPFEAATKRMTVVVDDSADKALAVLKGAPAVVLDACRNFTGKNGELVRFDESWREHFLEINRIMANRALRVLGFAEKMIGADSDFENEIVDDFTFLGFVGMSDPPRPGAAEAIKKAQNAGIRVVMLTGDQLNTARAVARQLQLDGDSEIVALHSSDLTRSNREEIAEMARRANVFARVTPEDKLNIVKALQDAGEIVAVTGDGVNDAPALKHADIGVAMGQRGTEVAKESADIILTDDNFKTIVTAIEGGRIIYSNIIKFVHMMFSHNLGEVLVIFAAIIAGLPLPLLPLQILWINLVTDVFPALALAVEPPSPGIMNRKPHSKGKALLSNRFMFLIFWQGLMLGAIALGAYLWALDRYGEGDHARTVALFSLIGVQAGHLFNCRSRTRSAFTGFFGNPSVFAAVAAVIFLQILAVYFPPLSRVLHTVAPTDADLTVIAISVILPVIIVEITKVVKRINGSKSETKPSEW